MMKKGKRPSAEDLNREEADLAALAKFKNRIAGTDSDFEEDLVQKVINPLLTFFPPLGKPFSPPNKEQSNDANNTPKPGGPRNSF